MLQAILENHYLHEHADPYYMFKFVGNSWLHTVKTDSKNLEKKFPSCSNDGTLWKT